jgi:hypothetical protein
MAQTTNGSDVVEVTKIDGAVTRTTVGSSYAWV